MKHTKYVGTFISAEGNTYTIQTTAFGFIQAFFLLTSDAIRSGKHYQLDNIVDEKGNKQYISDILQVQKIFYTIPK